MNYNLLNANTLAYMGDVVWSLYVREYLINKGITKSFVLQKNTINFVSAKAQAKIYFYLESNTLLSEKEIDIYKRGRNVKTNSFPKNTDMITYQISTGFEAMIGYLYLTKEMERIDSIFKIACQLIEG